MVKAFTTNLPTLMRIHVLIYMPGVFWNHGQDAYFDVRAFHPNAPSYCSMDLPEIYHRHELEKKQQKSQRMKEVDHHRGKNRVPDLGFYPIDLGICSIKHVFKVPKTTVNTFDGTDAKVDRVKPKVRNTIFFPVHGVFTPLVFSTTGGTARECSTFYRCLADIISIKQDKPYLFSCG